METRPGRFFRPYFAMSALCTIICLYHLWQDPYWKSRSFLDRVKLSRIGTAILGNMAFASLLLLYKGILQLFFGTITIAETQKMWQRLVNYMVFNLLAVSAILDPRLDVVLKWGSWLFLMASMRILCDLARNRFKALITYTPNAAWWIHGKIVMLLSLLLLVDVAVFSWAMHVRDELSKDQLFLVVSECLSLSVVATGALMKYVIYYVDMKHFAGQWEHRGSCSYYTDLFAKSIILMVSLVYYAVILHLHGVSLNIFFDILIIIRLVVIVVSLRTKFLAYQSYRQISNHIANLYKPLGPEEIEEYDDNCAICRDPMTSALRLPCGHIFHTTCLRSWLEHSQNCPTCRYSLLEQSPAPTDPVHSRRPPQNQRTDTTQHLDATLQQNTGSVVTNITGASSTSSVPRITVQNSFPATQPHSSTPTNSSISSSTAPTAPSMARNDSFGQMAAVRVSSPSRNTHRPRTVTSATEAAERHEQLNANGSRSIWSFTSPSMFAWFPSVSVEVVRGQDPGIGHLDQRDLTPHRENLEKIRALFPEIPENIALADLLETGNLQDTLDNIIENRLSWSPNGSSTDTRPSVPVPSQQMTQQTRPPTQTWSSHPTSPSAIPPYASASPQLASLASSSAPTAPTPTRATAAVPVASPSPTRTRLVQSSPNPIISPSSSSPASPLHPQATYQERKQAMIEACRDAYLQKKNSSAPQS